MNKIGLKKAGKSKKYPKFFFFLKNAGYDEEKKEFVVMLILWITRLKKEGWKERTKVKYSEKKEKKTGKRNILQKQSKKDYTEVKRKKIIPLKKERNIK